MIAAPHNQRTGGVSCLPINHSLSIPFERTSKRRKGFPSETQVKRGHRVVHGDKDLSEKLGRNDPCPCGSTRRFQKVLPQERQLRWLHTRSLLLGSERLQNKYGQKGCQTATRFGSLCRGTCSVCPMLWEEGRREMPPYPDN